MYQDEHKIMRRVHFGGDICAISMRGLHRGALTAE